MKMKKCAILVLAASLAGTGLGQPVLAQTGEASDEKGLLEEILVTATKREVSIYDVPLAVSAFTEEMIIKQGITGLTDIGKFVPNMNVTEFSAGHTSSVNAFIRGIGLQDHLITTDPGVGVYVDGVYLGRQVGQNWSLANIERIEVLRGPQGTLYGRNSIGGTINIITRKPGDEQGGQVSLEAGSRGRLNGSFYVNIPFSETFAVSFTGSYKSRDGIGDFINLNTSTEVGEMEELAGRVALRWAPNERFSVLVTGDKNDNDGGLRPYTTLFDEVPNGFMFQQGFRNSDTGPNPYDNATGQADQADISNEAHGISVTVDLAINENLDAKLILSDRSSKYESGLDDDSVVENINTFPEMGEADQKSAELQFTGQFGALDFVAGLYYFEEDGRNMQTTTVFQGPPEDNPFAVADFLLTQEMDSQAVYANIGYQINDRLRISGGVRYTEDDKDAHAEPVVGVISATSQRDWDELSWEVAATYEMRNRMHLYGTIQNGYQSGQFPPRAFCLFGDPDCFAASDNVTAINYEVGLKGTPTDNLRMSIAVFYTDYTDLPYQVSSSEGGGFNTVNIIVDQTSTGLEWESSWALTDAFILHATLGYIDVDVDDPNPAAVAPLTPEITASISPEYTHALDNGGELVFRADWSYRDEMFGEPSNDPGRNTLIGSRDIVNFDIAYHPPNGKWSLAAYGRNVTDERYDNARLNIGDYILIILSNDASEFGLRYNYNFGL